MRRWLVFLLALGLAGAASAATAPTANKINIEGKGVSMGDGAMSPRVGGEDIPRAVPVPYLPYSDNGVTCGYVNDYDEVCPYTGSTSPDVVYSYTPSANEGFGVDLCASAYDTKVYIYAGGQGNLIACNDDAGCGYSGYQSQISNITLSAGVTYYIVVDGYGGACGTYNIIFGGIPPSCPVECPGGATQEGEPPCGTNYVDSYNGGCNSVPQVFQPLVSQDQGCVDLCGKSGTYTYQGLSYRDTDWFDCAGTDATVTATLAVEFPAQFIFIYNPDCNNLQYDITTGGPCQPPMTLSRYVAADAHFWLWVGPSVFTGVPCEAPYGTNYLLHACGIAGVPPVPVQKLSWGAVKSLYQ